MKPDDELDSMVISCPKCGAQGQVRIDHMDRGMACKQCKAQFYIDTTGQCALGTPALKKDPSSKGRPQHAAPLTRRAKWQRFARDRWQRLPQWGKIASAAVPLLLLAAGIVGWAAKGGIELPLRLIDRGRLLGEYVARNNESGIDRLAASGTSGAAEEWFAQKRPAGWMKDVPADMPVRADVEVVFQSDGKGEACLKLLVRKPSGAAGSELELITFWSKTDDQWLLDGKRTLLGPTR